MVNSIKLKNLFLVYFFGFLLAFHVALPSYINSSFLNIFISEKLLGIIYIVASILTILLFFIAPYILQKFGNFRVAVTLVTMEAVALLGLIMGRTTVWVVMAFLLSQIVISFIYFSLDIFLESYSKNSNTGKIRGTYLTLANLAWIFSPVIAGFILANGEYWKVYLVSLMFLIPILLILIINLRGFKDSAYQATPVLKTFQRVWKNKNIRNIFSASFLLSFFYSWMTIYTPLYLYKYANFSWTQIGIIFGIMLLPFVFIQFPLGKIADEKIGEKEILSLGFVVIAISTFSLFFIPLNSSMWLWACLLFITRIGAASVEVMCDTYFFKKVNNLDTNIISFFRMARPLAYILGPLFASLCLLIMGAREGQLFLILGIILLCGLFFSLNIKDTK